MEGSYEFYVFVFEQDSRGLHSTFEVVPTVAPDCGTSSCSTSRSPGGITFSGASLLVHVVPLRGSQMVKEYRPVNLCLAGARAGECYCREGAAGTVCSERPMCGDSVIQPAEMCDDGNSDAGDGCNELCSIE